MSAKCIGCGLEIDPVTGLLEVQTRPNGGIGCDNGSDPTLAGLYVVAGSTTMSTTDSATVAFTGNGSSGSHLSAVVKKSTAACNGIRLDADPGGGVWAPAGCTVAFGDLRGYDGATFPITLNTGGAALFGIESDGGAVSVHNPFDCEIKGLWDVQAYGGRVAANPGFDGYAYLVTSFDGGVTYFTAAPATFFRMDNRTSAGGDPNGGVVEYNINNLWERNYDAYAGLATHTYRAGVKIQVTAGTGTWYDTLVHSPGGSATLEPPRFEFHWHFTPTGVC